MRALNTSRVWIAAAAVAGLIMIAATYLLVISPARSDAATVQSQIDDASLAQAGLRRKLAELEAASKAVGPLRAVEAAAKAAIPSSFDSQGLLRQVHATSVTHRVTIGSVAISPAQPAVVSGVWGLPVTIVLNGAPADLVSAVADLQGAVGRALSVSATTLQVVADGSASLSLDLTMFSTAAPPTAGGSTAAPAKSGAPGTSAGGSTPSTGSTPSAS